jgi:hypothetical protein
MLGNLLLMSFTCCATLPEDRFRMAAMGTDMGAHVFDDADDQEADFLEHLQALA